MIAGPKLHMGVFEHNHAAKFGVHRRLVRQAIGNALPPKRHYPACAKPKLGAVAAFGAVRAEQQKPIFAIRHICGWFDDEGRGMNGCGRRELVRIVNLATIGVCAIILLGDGAVSASAKSS